MESTLGASSLLSRMKPERTSRPDKLHDGGRKKRRLPPNFHPRKPLSDDDARRLIIAKERYLRLLRRNQGPLADIRRWIRRTPQQMALLHHNPTQSGHVLEAIRAVRSLAELPDPYYHIEHAMRFFADRLTFREMCIVLKHQRGWRLARLFFHWMKLQDCYRPSTIVYTILLRAYGQVGKIKLAEELFLEMLESGCEPDEVACDTMLCTYARWCRQKTMMEFYSAVRRRDILPSITVFNFMMSSFHEQKNQTSVIYLWNQILDAGLEPNRVSYMLAICSFVKKDLLENALGALKKMKNAGFVPEESTYRLLIVATIKHCRGDDALRLYEEMQVQGITPSIYTFASVLALLYKNDEYSKALSLFSEMKRNKIDPDETIYGILIRIYGKLGLYRDAQRTFQDIKKLDILTNEKTYVAMAQVHLNSGSFDKALDVLYLMKSRITKPSKFAYFIFLQCYIAKEDVGAAELTFQALCRDTPLDAIWYHKMLIFYLKLKLIEKAKALISQIRKYEVPFNRDLHRTILEVFCRERMATDAMQLVDRMQALGLEMDNRDKILLIRLYGKTGALQLAEDLLRTLEKPDAASLCVMLRSYLKNGDNCKASEMLKSLLRTTNGFPIASQLMLKLAREGCAIETKWIYERSVDLGFKPDDASTASLIRFYGKRQQLKDASEIYSLASHSIITDKAVYTSMIAAYCKCCKVTEAELLYKEMNEKGCDAGAVTVSILVSAFGKHGMFQKAERLIHDSFSRDAELDTVAYNTFIKTTLDSGKLDLAVGIFDRMIDAGVSPSLQTYNTMISVHGKGGRLSRAIDMFNAALDSGFSIDEKTYANMIRYYGQCCRVQEASLLFSKMKASGIKPGKVSCNIMMNSYAANGLPGEAESILEGMKRDGQSPDAASYLALIRAYAESGRYSDAEGVFCRMREDEISPSRAHFNPLVLALAREGRVEDAERICGLMRRNGVKPDTTCCRAMLRAYMDQGMVHEGLSFFECAGGVGE